MQNALSRILQRQQDWVAERGIIVEPPGYTETVEANLLQKLHPETTKDFERGDGGELGRHGHRGKMQALRSSSALVVNVFDYWRDRPKTWIAKGLSLSSEPSSLCFEAKFENGLRQGHSPNLDLAIVLADKRIVAVESKFTETYTRVSRKEPFKDKYFPAGSGRWHDLRLPNCQRLADRLRRGDARFLYLNAAQLLKHALGLAQPEVGAVTLVYLWYAVPSSEATQHEKEVEEFTREIGAELDFRALTYQKLFSAALRDVGAAHAAYVDYIGERYFPELRA